MNSHLHYYVQMFFFKRITSLAIIKHNCASEIENYEVFKVHAHSIRGEEGGDVEGAGVEQELR